MFIGKKTDFLSRVRKESVVGKITSKLSIIVNCEINGSKTNQPLFFLSFIINAWKSRSVEKVEKISGIY